MDAVPSTRTRILQAAVELMGREGPDGFSASALAREVGVSKATIFHHFDALAEIPMAALEEVFYQFLGDMVSDGGTLRARLDQFGRETRALVDNERLLHAYFVFVIKGIFDDRLRDRFIRGAFELHRRTKEVVAPALGPDEDPEVATRMVEVMLDGLALHHLVMGDHETLDGVWQRFTELLVAAQNPEEAP